MSKYKQKLVGNMRDRLKKLLLPLLLFILYTSGVLAQVRVLLYHAHPNFGFTESLFTEHMDFLYNNDYHTISLDQFIDWRNNNEPLPIRPIVLTIDDNYIRTYTIVYPVLQARGFVGTNFAHTDYVGVPGPNDHCDWNEIQEMETAGVLLTESHTKSHPNLTTIPVSEAQEEIEGSKVAIEANLLNKVCKYIAYPGGAYNSTVITLCQNANYIAGFTVGGGINYHDTPLFELQRIGVDGINLETFKERIGYNSLPPAPPGPGWTIDNDAANFFVDTQEWPLSTTVPGYYGSNYRYHPQGDGSHKARWAAYLPLSDDYRVYAWWTDSNNRATDAPYEIHHTAGVTIVRMNQQANGGQWNLLGQFHFSADIPAEVYLRDDANGYVIADGVWFEPLYLAVSDWYLY